MPALRRLRFIPLAVGAASFAVGLWMGLSRLGVDLPGGPPAVADLHAAFVIAGFFGTVISLERAVAIGRWWPYGAPMASALGALALIGGLPYLGGILFLAASMVLFAASVDIAFRRLALFTACLAVAAGCWTVGALQWLYGHSVPEVAGWWLSFLVLTIAAERLELGRVISPPPASQAAFVFAVALVLAGNVQGGLSPLFGAGLLLLALWLLHYDVARKTVRLAQQPRFSAVCMLAGHVWLAIAGVLVLAANFNAAPFIPDAAIHAIAIGFVLSMVFGHAPIILPAVTGLRLRYTSLAYGPLMLLHAAVMLRVLGGLFSAMQVRAASGVLTVLALLGYAAVLFGAALYAKRP